MTDKTVRERCYYDGDGLAVISEFVLRYRYDSKQNKNHHNPRLNTRSRVMWSYVARKKGQSNYRDKGREKTGKKKSPLRELVLE